jgi:hypothetical protein
LTGRIEFPVSEDSSGFLLAKRPYQIRIKGRDACLQAQILGYKPAPDGTIMRIMAMCTGIIVCDVIPQRNRKSMAQRNPIFIEHPSSKLAFFDGRVNGVLSLLKIITVLAILLGQTGFAKKLRNQLI